MLRIAIIGRTEVLYDTAVLLREQGHEIALIITAKEAQEYVRTATDFEALANEWRVPFLSTPRISEAIAMIKELPTTDIGVSVNYSGVIPQEVIDLFPMGIMNAHGGDLPRYRGNACQAWAIINGEERIGLCVHRMIGGELDSGNILAREYFELNIDRTVTQVHKWITDRTPFLFIEAISALEQDPNYVLEVQSLDPNASLRCYPRKPEDGCIDWGKSAVEVLRLINGCNKPYGGAFCDYEGEKLIIWSATLAPDEIFLAIPGQITKIGNGYVDVACGEGKIRMSEVETSGNTSRPDEIIRSIRKRLG